MPSSVATQLSLRDRVVGKEGDFDDFDPIGSENGARIEVFEEVPALRSLKTM